MIEFKGFDKIPRLKRAVVITEKIDGTNAQVYICKIADHPADMEWDDKYRLDTWIAPDAAGINWQWAMYAGSRNRWISPGKDDNYGFAGWVKENAAELRKLGEGQHFGEWWGRGIGRNYGLTERRFSLFNTHRWNDQNPNRPRCCHVVPTISQGDIANEKPALNFLIAHGSVAAPGFMKPEGIVVYHTAAKNYFKVTIEKDEQPKGFVEVVA